MEDYILKEISKVSEIIVSLLERFRLRRASRTESYSESTAKGYLFERLNIDIDLALEHNDIVGVLTSEYGFKDEDLDDFAEVLYHLMFFAEEDKRRVMYIDSIMVIYRYLNENSSVFSFNRFGIEEELRKIKNKCLQKKRLETV